MTASAFCLVSAGAFFLAGLAAGVWKYVCIATSAGARAPVYVDMTHRASLLYAFACALLAEIGRRSTWSNGVNLAAAIVLVSLFAITVAGYAVHGALRDTDNQLARPHRLGRLGIPSAVMVTFMVLLSAGEIGAFLVLFAGYLAGNR
jgi:hypothetical protein